MPRTDFCLIHRLRVRWAEVDPQGIVFNGNYLTYADVAITEYFRALGISFPDGLAEQGGDFFAVKALLEYRAPARFDDELDLGIRVSRLGRSSLTFSLGIWRRELLLTSGEVIYVHAAKDGSGSRPLPGWLREKICNFESCPPE
jgi:acyl-CoA thioester hydrolase